VNQIDVRPLKIIAWTCAGVFVGVAALMVWLVLASPG
jgi:hypothetical protein